MKSWLSKIASPKNIALASLLLGTASLDAKTIYVNGAVVGGNKNGTSWANAYPFLRDAVEAANAGDNIYVAKGTYYPDQGANAIFGEREEAFTFTDAGVKVYGGFVGTETSLAQRVLTVGNETILSGRIWDGTGEELYSSLNVTVVEADTTFDGITIREGNANGYESWVYSGEPKFNQGGACYVMNSSQLTLANCTITANTAYDAGGAIMFEGGNGSLFATDTTFSANKVTTFHLYNSFDPQGTNAVGAGGAVYLPNGTVVATDCKFSTNSVTAIVVDGEEYCTARGGAIVGTVNALRCEFDSNLARSTQPEEGLITCGSFGGAIFGNATVRECKFNLNSAIASTFSNNDSMGGAINGTNVVATKCAFSGNISTAGDSYGGAISGTTASVVNCSFSANTAGAGNLIGTSTYFGGGGAVFVTTGKSTLTNSVFFNNTSQFLGGAVAIKSPVSVNSNINAAGVGNLDIEHCTFVDNGSATAGQGGAALSVQGFTRILNNIFWNSTASNGAFNRSNLIDIKSGGVLRNTTDKYPAPVNFALNLVNGGLPSVTLKTGGDRYLGNTATTLVNGNPTFFSSGDPDGLDNLYGTKDDGLRLTAGSPAIRTTSTETTRGVTVPYEEFVATDVQDMDDDGNLAEKLPADMGGYIRVQDSFVDLGAYEFGTLRHEGEIQVEQPVGTILVTSVGAIDFGSVSGLPVTKTVTIRNVGVANLNNLAITTSGANVGDFTVTDPLVTKVASGASTTFKITFTPKADGARTMTLQIISDDFDENPFIITVNGTGSTPDIAVEQPASTALTDGVSVIDYGQSSINSTSSKTFTVRNTGAGHLGITSVKVAGANSADFKAFLPASSILAPGASTTLRVEFTPSATGARSALLSIISNDPDAEGSFDVNLAGQGTDNPEIKVAQPTSSELTTGGSRSYGSVKRGLIFAKDFTITNVGVKPLKNIAVSISGDADFSLVKPTASQLNSGENVKFKVSFKPTSLGAKSAVVKIKSNDADENPFVINVSGTGISASSAAKIALEAVVRKSNSLVQDDDATVSVRTTADGLSYLVLTVQKSSDWSVSNRRVEVSGNLVDWYSGKKHTKVLVDDESTLRVQDKTPVTPNKKRYIRLK